MAELNCPCGLRDYMETEDCEQTLCCECCPIQKEQNSLLYADLEEIIDATY